GAQHGATADAGGAQEARRRALERQRRTAVADPFVVERDDARPAENFVLDDDAARQITTALQRHEIADAHVPLDVDERPDHTMAADNGMVADKDEVADARVLADLRRFRDDA